MNKALIGLVAVIIVVAGGWFIFSHNSSPKASPSPSPSMAMTNPPSGQATSQNATTTSAVTIKGFAFAPAAISVKKGTTVTWTNQDSVGHTVTETDGQTGPSSATLDQGKSYSFTFTTTGAFHYHCSIHPEMTGTVTVTE